MKSAEEWKESFPILLFNPNNKKEEVKNYLNFIKRIQKDAWEDGFNTAKKRGKA